MVKSRLGHHTEVGVHAAHGHVICQSANLSLLAALDVVLPQEVHVRKRRHYWMQRQTFLGEFSTGKIWKWMMVQVHLRLARMKKSMILKIFWNLRLVITREINKKRHFQIYLITFFIQFIVQNDCSYEISTSGHFLFDEASTSSSMTSSKAKYSDTKGQRQSIGPICPIW